MLRRLKKCGQSTGEYAIVFALVLGAVIAMQAYIRGGLQRSISVTGKAMVDRTYHELDEGLDPAYKVPRLTADDYRYKLLQQQQTTTDTYSKRISYHNPDDNTLYSSEIPVGEEERSGSRGGSRTVYKFSVN